jgi:ABC-type spermidine/putrescine transport system permease subunit I
VGGRVTLIGNLIAAQFGEFLNWPLGAAMSFTVLLVAAAVIGLFASLMRLVQPT